MLRLTGPEARVLAAEAIGTGALVSAVVGSGIMAASLTQDTGLALLCNTVATGAALYVLITLFGPISGAQFNPAVSLVLALRGEIGWRTAGRLMLAQVAGGLAGTLLAHAMFGLAVLQISHHVRTGPAQALAEGVATCGLIATILLGRRARPEALPMLVALYITAAYWFTASTSFANPAVALARGFSDTFAGIRPWDVPGFALAELAGAVLAVPVCGWLLGSDRERNRT
ncbi:MAG: aquaporin family protein [Paracoccaceae bacterium]|nr:aquaporin family protein [Paracoccaceae bacterium]